ncbi:MAG: molecular chaperone DnaK [Planctomycetes bacterium]|nr:molecular chaperone DnaK [Planctomycetota bacterium]
MGFLQLNVLNQVEALPPVGIDLGTTNSLVAIWENGRPTVVHPEGDNGYVPSCVYFPSDGPPIVGKEARERAVFDPEHALFSVKRFMGRGLADVANDLKGVPFRAQSGKNGVIEFDVRGRKLTPQEVSALVLEKCGEVAALASGGRALQKAVITVPAYFDDAQRQATRDAARLAGIEVLRIVNEPTAASLAYGLDQKKQGNVAVYDLGGGTFDVSILAIEDGVFRVLSTNGDTHLGGDDFDRCLVSVALTELSHSVDPRKLDEPAFLQALRLAAEKCKIELSTYPEAEMHIQIPDSNGQWRRRFTRDEFESLTKPLIDRTLDCCRRALSDAGLEVAKIDEVVLVGGVTRMPAVRMAVQQLFGRVPHTKLNPDEVVALGAAVQAHVLSGGTRDVLLMDVTPLSLGLETVGGAVAKVILRNATIPCQATEGFTTYVDNQTAIDFNVLQGERELASDCRSLGKFRLSGIPPMPAGLARVAVRFHIDANGLLTVTAKEQSTGISSRIEVQPQNGLTDADVQRMLASAYEHAKDDFAARRATELVTEIGTMLRATEKGLAEAKSQLDRETILDIEDAMKNAREACSTRDAQALQRSRDAFEKATLPLAAVLMDNFAKKALTGKVIGDM